MILPRDNLLAEAEVEEATTKSARAAALKANKLAYPLKGQPKVGDIHKAIEAHKVAGSLATKPAEKSMHQRQVAALGRHAESQASKAAGIPSAAPRTYGSNVGKESPHVQAANARLRKELNAKYASAAQANKVLARGGFSSSGN